MNPAPAFGEVMAKKEIRAGTGRLVVASPGARGRAVPGAIPGQEHNWGKILVFWNGCRHGYWCDPHALRFPRDDPGIFVARKPALGASGLVRMPRRKARYEYDYGHNLRKIRRSRGLTQQALGEAMSAHGVSLGQSVICYREKRTDCPSGRFVQAAARALEVPPFVFFLDLEDCATLKPVRHFLCDMSSKLCGGE
jgi:hypothetical protein